MRNRNSWLLVSCAGTGLLLGSLSNGFARPPRSPQSKLPAQSVPQESHKTVDVNTRPQLFAVLCALDAAGFNSAMDTSNEPPGRTQLRRRMLALQGPAVDALRKYYNEHAFADSGATFSRFVSFALAAGPPPKFQFELRREDLPPDALSLEGFTTILTNFYAEAKLDELWQFYQPEYERAVDAYRAPVADLIFSVSNYLREIIRPSTGRSFSIYVELLAGNETNFRNYGDHYELVVSPSKDLPTDDIRHAFLHFLLDPIAIRYRVNASRLSPVLEYAARAPLLPAEMHDDFPPFLTNVWFVPSSSGCAGFRRRI
jgi:hypothetical protein